MLHTTFRMAREAGTCSSEYNKMAKALGGIKKYGADMPIPLDRVLEVCGLDAALWCLCCVIEPAEREIRLLACDFAEHTLPIFEEKYPYNKQPRQAIEISRRFAEGKAILAEMAAAGAVAVAVAEDVWDAALATRAVAGDVAGDILAAARAAWAAAGAVALDAPAAAWDAGWAAARDAARAAERQWQEKKFREMLNK